jgi:hypothetical protein
MRYHYYAKGDRFPYYREIAARFDSTGSCGHEIRKGERIGWNPRVKKTQCAACWAQWTAENAEADAIERGYVGNCL